MRGSNQQKQDEGQKRAKKGHPYWVGSPGEDHVDPSSASLSGKLVTVLRLSGFRRAYAVEPVRTSAFPVSYRFSPYPSGTFAILVLIGL